jgi:RHS repeat-associated protein
VNAATNRLANAGYDANGNMNSGAGATLGYDEANRIVSATEVSGGTEYYSYAPDGKRIFRAPADGSPQEWTFWGARGEKLGTFNMVYNQYSNGYLPVLNPTVWFAGKKIREGGGLIVQDRLGSTTATYPYGDEIAPNTLSRTKFASYFRDGFTGLDYADQRYYASGYGRFTKPDPGSAGSTNNPQSLNRYSYVLGDPINNNDPRGLCTALLGGITQTPYTAGTSGEQAFADQVGEVSSFGYEGGSLPAGLANVFLAQGVGVPTGAVASALNAILLAAQNPGPIDIVTFSGGAQAFTSAFSYLNAATQNRIQSITYVDPAGTGSLSSGTSSTSVRVFGDSSDWVNTALEFAVGSPTNPNPASATYYDTGACGHDANCAFNIYGDMIGYNDTSCSSGAGAIFGVPKSSAFGLGYAQAVGGYAGAALYFYLSNLGTDPTPSVTSTIRYDVQ